MTYTGLNASTGQPISDIDHIRQSCAIILTTPVGSRVMRRNFGSLLPDLIDKPLNGKTRMQCMAATAMALRQWEPRLSLTSVTLSSNGPALTIDIDTIRRDGHAAGQRVQLSVPVRSA